MKRKFKKIHYGYYVCENGNTSIVIEIANTTRKNRWALTYNHLSSGRTIKESQYFSTKEEATLNIDWNLQPENPFERFFNPKKDQQTIKFMCSKEDYLKHATEIGKVYVEQFNEGKFPNTYIFFVGTVNKVDKLEIHLCKHLPNESLKECGIRYQIVGF